MIVSFPGIMTSGSCFKALAAIVFLVIQSSSQSKLFLPIAKHVGPTRFEQFGVYFREVSEQLANTTEFTSADDVESYLDTDCVPVSDRLHRNCKSSSLSCHGRCGAGPIPLDESFNVCSCDSECGVYNNCCWDFALHCRAESEHYRLHFSHLGTALVTCVHGHSIISGCDKGQGTIRLQESIDHRIPVVTVANTSLSFINASVYAVCFGNQSSQYQLIPWDKQINTMYPILYEEFREYSTTGQASLAILAAISNTNPDDTVMRHCGMDAFRIYCYDLSEYDLCKGVLPNERYIQVRNTGSICNSFINEHLGERDTASTTIDSAPRESQTMATGGSTTEAMAGGGHGKCLIVTFSMRRQRWRPRFSIILSYEAEYVTSMSIANLGHYTDKVLMNLTFTPGNSGGQDKLKAECPLGFFPRDFNCFAPKDFCISLVSQGRNTTHIEEMVENTVQDLEDTSEGQLVLLHPGSLKAWRDTVSEYEVIYAEHQVIKHQLFYEGDRLPVTSKILDHVRQTDTGKSLVYKMTVCVSVPTPDEVDDDDDDDSEMMICDEIHNSQFVRHFMEKHRECPHAAFDNFLTNGGRDFTALVNAGQHKNVHMVLSIAVFFVLIFY